jgi:L-lactate permease
MRERGPTIAGCSTRASLATSDGSATCAKRRFAANSSGGVMGKMIDAQSIVVAAVATGGRPDSPDAGTVLRAVFWHSIALAALVGLLVYAQAKIYPFTEMVVR